VSLEELQQALLDIVPSHNELASNRLHERSRASHDRMAMISMREQEELKECTFKPHLVSKQTFTDVLLNISAASETSAEDIQHLVAYIKGSCGSSVGGHTEEILLPELEAAYRKLKQVVMLEDKNQLGKKLFLRFKDLLNSLSLSPAQFFRRFDTRGSLDYTGGDGKLSPMELRDGINRLCDSSGLPRWKHTEYSVLVRYMDPNADGDITEEELLGAFERIEDTETEDSLKLRIKRLIPIVLQLEQMMVSKKMRMKDLFMSIDTDKSGTVSLEELQQALLDIVPSHNELASNRLHERSYAIHEGITSSALREQEELKECTFKPQLSSKHSYQSLLHNLSTAKATTYEDIQHLVAYIKGSCGSGGGSHTEEILLPELEAAYRKLRQVVLMDEEKTRLGRNRPSLQLSKDASPVAAEVTKRLVPIVLHLEKIMITKKMRIKDLFMQIDTDKSGSVSADELSHALREILV
jgi:Ca2+-binding EF-hand superfamily protein